MIYELRHLYTTFASGIHEFFRRWVVITVRGSSSGDLVQAVNGCALFLSLSLYWCFTTFFGSFEPKQGWERTLPKDGYMGVCTYMSYLWLSFGISGMGFQGA
jgi:hypothetical protein